MSERIKTVDMSDLDVVLDCYRKLDTAYKRLRAENETLRRDVKTAVMGDSAELQDVKRENKKLREVLIAAMIREHQAYLTCEDIVHNYDWELDLKQTDIVGLIENMRHTIKGARDRAINDDQYRILNAFYIKNAGVSGWLEKQDLCAAAAAIRETDAP